MKERELRKKERVVWRALEWKRKAEERNRQVKKKKKKKKENQDAKSYREVAI